MRYSAAVASAVVIAATAEPALAAPSGLGLRAVEEDALAQRSFDDELYARDLIFGREDRPVRPPLHHNGPYRAPEPPRPPKRKASSSPPRRPGPGPAKPIAPGNPQQRRELDELYAREPMSGERSGRLSLQGLAFRPKPKPTPRQPSPKQAPPKKPHDANVPSIVVTPPKNRRDLDEYLLARATEEDERFARALEDAVFARMDVDDLD